LAAGLAHGSLDTFLGLWHALLSLSSAVFAT
jgi:hypothetical protein